MKKGWFTLAIAAAMSTYSLISIPAAQAAPLLADASGTPAPSATAPSPAISGEKQGDRSERKQLNEHQKDVRQGVRGHQKAVRQQYRTSDNKTRAGWRRLNEHQQDVRQGVRGHQQDVRQKARHQERNSRTK